MGNQIRKGFPDFSESRYRAIVRLVVSFFNRLCHCTVNGKYLDMNAYRPKRTKMKSRLKDVFLSNASELKCWCLKF